MDLERHLSIKRCLHDNLSFTKTQISHLVQRSLDNYEVDAVEYFDLRDDHMSKQRRCIFKHAFIPCGNCTIEKQTQCTQGQAFQRALLSLKVEEIKNLSQKKSRYFCYLWIDDELVWKSTSKYNQANSGNVLWFEKLEFKNVPTFKELRLEIYHRRELKKLSRRGSLSTLLNPVNFTRNSFKDRGNYEILGSVIFNWDFLNSLSSVDDWFTVMKGKTSEDHTSSSQIPVSESSPRMRVSINLTLLNVLPLESYYEIKKMILCQSLDIFDSLEKVTSAQVKDQISRCIVRLFEINQISFERISTMIRQEVSNQTNMSMIFRQNSFSSKLAENYMKIFGDEYLKLLLSDLIKRVVDQKLAWEVDPSKFITSTQQKCSFLMTPSHCGYDPTKATLVNPKTNQLNIYPEKLIRDYCIWNNTPLSHEKLDRAKIKTPWLSTHLILANQLSVESLSPCSQTGPHGSNGNNPETYAYTMNNDGEVVQSHSLIQSQCALLQYLDLLWRAVQLSVSEFPKKLLEFFVAIREALSEKFSTELCNQVISSCLFLRFLCPAILSPSLFNILSSYPTDSAVRKNLTLLSKSLLSMTNFNANNEKEPHMTFLNTYIECQLDRVENFLLKISSRTFCPDPVKTERSYTLTESSSSSSGLTTSTSSKNSYSKRSPIPEEAYERIVLAELHHVLQKNLQTNMENNLSQVLHDLFSTVQNLDPRLQTNAGSVKSRLEIGSLIDVNRRQDMQNFCQSFSMNKLYAGNSGKESIYRESDYDEPFSSSSDDHNQFLARNNKCQSPIYDCVAVSINDDEDINQNYISIEHKKDQKTHAKPTGHYQIYENVENLQGPKSQLNYGQLNASYRNLNEALESLETQKNRSNGHRSSIDLYHASTMINGNLLEKRFTNQSYKTASRTPQRNIYQY